MARQPSGPEAPIQSAPEEYAQVPPRDLYPTSDLRFVMIEIGKLTASVNRLLDDVKSQGSKIDDLRHQAPFVKGAIYIGVLLVGVFITIASFFLSAKWDAAVQAIRSVTK